MVEKGIRGGTCHVEHRYAKTNNKYMKEFDSRTESSYLMYWDFNNLYGWVMSQKLAINGFKWKKKESRFTQEFIQNYNSDRKNIYP